MKTRYDRGARSRWQSAWAAALLLLTCWPHSAAAQLPTVTKVEEDWELVLSEPDPTHDAPQVTTCISPTPNQIGLHMAFELNHSSQPSFVAGGMQLQLWDSETLLSYKNHTESGKLSTAGEVVRWTQRMRIVGSYLIFSVENGESTTWNTFGQQSALTAYRSTSLSDLNGYSPDISVANSGVGFAGNRVGSLVLKKVRLYLSSGEVLEDATPRSVFPKP